MQLPQTDPPKKLIQVVRLLALPRFMRPHSLLLPLQPRRLEVPHQLPLHLPRLRLVLQQLESLEPRQRLHQRIQLPLLQRQLPQHLQFPAQIPDWLTPRQLIPQQQTPRRLILRSLKHL